MTEASRAEIERAVLSANASFYRAFSQGNFAAMNALWAVRAPVACLHPGAPLLLGRDAVLGSFRQILDARPTFVLRCEAPTAQIFGETAIVYCYEAGADQPAHLAATNVFVREDDAWRMVHHHAGPLSNPIPTRTASSLMN